MVVIKKDIKSFETRIIKVLQEHDVIETDFTNFLGILFFTVWCKDTKNQG